MIIVNNHTKIKVVIDYGEVRYTAAGPRQQPPYNKKLVEETANMLRKKHKITVHVAFLNKDTPVIKEALEAIEIVK